jgi:hypothetical protein
VAMPSSSSRMMRLPSTPEAWARVSWVSLSPRPWATTATAETSAKLLEVS